MVDDRTGVSRREILAGSAAALAATGISTAAAAADAVDVIVVGAGFSGLTAARTLKRANKSVLVLEADDRVGGRTKPALLAGETIDIGGQWVGPTQTQLLALAKAYGVHPISQYVAGDNIIDVNGRRVRYKGETPALAETDLQDFGAAVAELESHAATLAMPKPWLAKGAAEWDLINVESWIKASIRGDAGRSLMRLIVRAVLSSEPSEVSLLFFLGYIRAAGGVDALTGTQGGAQDSYFPGGVWQIARRMAAELGNAVLIGAPVQAISQDGAGVVVTSRRGIHRASRVVVSAPPALASRIYYAPPLPATRDGLSQRLALGCVIKIALAYDRPFWRDQGLTGQVISDRTEFGPWFDRVSPLTRGGALVGFFDGGPAQRWADRPAAERRARVLDDLALYLGDQARAPVDYVEEVWTRSQYHRGGYVSVAGPGVLTGFGPALLDPVGRIHWAGTETADVWAGYIDGAIRSGERAAREVLEAG